MSQKYFDKSSLGVEIIKSNRISLARKHEVLFHRRKTGIIRV